jgi:hypothetical protein
MGHARMITVVARSWRARHLALPVRLELLDLEWTPGRRKKGRFARGANPHLSDDETVAKMGTRRLGGF